MTTTMPSNNPTTAAPLATYHHELVAAAETIGALAECAAWASEDLARRLAATGKPVAALTLGELLAALAR